MATWSTWNDRMESNMLYIFPRNILINNYSCSYGYYWYYINMTNSIHVKIHSFFFFFSAHNPKDDIAKGSQNIGTDQDLNILVSLQINKPFVFSKRTSEVLTELPTWYKWELHGPLQRCSLLLDLLILTGHRQRGIFIGEHTTVLGQCLLTVGSE